MKSIKYPVLWWKVSSILYYDKKYLIFLKDIEPNTIIAFYNGSRWFIAFNIYRGVNKSGIIHVLDKTFNFFILFEFWALKKNAKKNSKVTLNRSKNLGNQIFWKKLMGKYFLYFSKFFLLNSSNWMRYKKCRQIIRMK